MTTIDLTPFYRSSIGFDRLASMLDSALSTDQPSGNSPAYNIKNTSENKYAITISVAGFTRNEIELQVENNVLIVKGNKETPENKDQYLYQGFSVNPFERKFNLAEHVEVTGAELNNGLLTISLVKEVPEALKPRIIKIDTDEKILEHQPDSDKAA